jgi:membrane-associated phospholipid phosphatase
MGLVQAWGELRLDRTAEILAQIDNQSPFVAAVIGLHPERHPFTIELLVNALQFTVLVEMQFKHALACWRPHEYSPQVQPMITTPGHGAFPSGHATQAFMLARLLDGLLDLSPRVPPSTARQLYRQAARIATNRVVAGVHFPADSIAGRLLGHVIAEYVLARLGILTDVCVRSFDTAGVNGKTLDLDLAAQPIDPPPPPTAPPTVLPMGYTIGGLVPVSAAAPASSVLLELFNLGAAERAALKA